MTATVPQEAAASGRAFPTFLSSAEDCAGPSWESEMAKSEQMSEVGMVCGARPVSHAADCDRAPRRPRRLRGWWAAGTKPLAGGGEGGGAETVWAGLLSLRGSR